VIRRQVVREVAAGRHVIVAGDFNDYDARVTDAGASEPITSVLRTIRSAGPGVADDLFNSSALVPRDSRYTVGRDNDGDGRLEAHEVAAVDHILVSPTLSERLASTHVASSPEARAVSDHLPLVITLRDGRRPASSRPGSD
jgi:endonuclease/exonuclease/phosphatase family metal-dependent hydrolase